MIRCRSIFGATTHRSSFAETCQRKGSSAFRIGMVTRDVLCLRAYLVLSLQAVVGIQAPAAVAEVLDQIHTVGSAVINPKTGDVEAVSVKIKRTEAMNMYELQHVFLLEVVVLRACNAMM